MRRDSLRALGEWIGVGPAVIGEIVITREAAGGYTLRHRLDHGCSLLQEGHTPEEARRLALYAADGSFRPLKTAPNLRRGWLLRLPDLEEVRRALDYFYPAMFGVWLDFRVGQIAAIPLRETLARQTGMYAVTKRITDEQAQGLIGGFCQSATGCLKRILWPVADGVRVSTLPREKFDPGATEAGEVPMLCHEACNFLVAKAREVVKGSG